MDMNNGNGGDSRGDSQLEKGKSLLEAYRVINGERNEQHGCPEENFSRIADWWNLYLEEREEGELSPKDVALMMALMKLARIMGGNYKKDSYVDLLGYAALAEEMELEEKEIEEKGIEEKEKGDGGFIGLPF